MKINDLVFVTGLLLTIYLGLILLTVTISFWRREKETKGWLADLIGESYLKPSMARFQNLIFTFVIAISLFIIVAGTGKFPEIPGGVFALLGISSGTYLISKATSTNIPSEQITAYKDEIKRGGRRG